MGLIDSVYRVLTRSNSDVTHPPSHDVHKNIHSNVREGAGAYGPKTPTKNLKHDRGGATPRIYKTPNTGDQFKLRNSVSSQKSKPVSEPSKKASINSTNAVNVGTTDSPIHRPTNHSKKTITTDDGQNRYPNQTLPTIANLLNTEALLPHKKISQRLQDVVTETRDYSSHEQQESNENENEIEETFDKLTELAEQQIVRMRDLSSVLEAEDQLDRMSVIGETALRAAKVADNTEEDSTRSYSVSNASPKRSKRNQQDSSRSQKRHKPGKQDLPSKNQSQAHLQTDSSKDNEATKEQITNTREEVLIDTTSTITPPHGSPSVSHGISKQGTATTTPKLSNKRQSVSETIDLSIFDSDDDTSPEPDNKPKHQSAPKRKETMAQKLKRLKETRRATKRKHPSKERIEKRKRKTNANKAKSSLSDIESMPIRASIVISEGERKSPKSRIAEAPKRPTPDSQGSPILKQPPSPVLRALLDSCADNQSTSSDEPVSNYDNSSLATEINREGPVKTLAQDTPLSQYSENGIHGQVTSQHFTSSRTVLEINATKQSRPNFTGEIVETRRNKKFSAAALLSLFFGEPKPTRPSEEANEQLADHERPKVLPCRNDQDVLFDIEQQHGDERVGVRSEIERSSEENKGKTRSVTEPQSIIVTGTEKLDNNTENRDQNDMERRTEDRTSHEYDIDEASDVPDDMEDTFQEPYDDSVALNQTNGERGASKTVDVSQAGDKDETDALDSFFVLDSLQNNVSGQRQTSEDTHEAASSNVVASSSTQPEVDLFKSFFVLETPQKNAAPHVVDFTGTQTSALYEQPSRGEVEAGTSSNSYGLQIDENLYQEYVEEMKEHVSRFDFKETEKTTNVLLDPQEKSEAISSSQVDQHIDFGDEGPGSVSPKFATPSQYQPKNHTQGTDTKSSHQTKRRKRVSKMQSMLSLMNSSSDEDFSPDENDAITKRIYQRRRQRRNVDARNQGSFLLGTTGAESNNVDVPVESRATSTSNTHRSQSTNANDFAAAPDFHATSSQSVISQKKVIEDSQDGQTVTALDAIPNAGEPNLLEVERTNSQVYSSNPSSTNTNSQLCQQGSSQSVHSTTEKVNEDVEDTTFDMSAIAISIEEAAVTASNKTKKQRKRLKEKERSPSNAEKRKLPDATNERVSRTDETEVHSVDISSQMKEGSDGITKVELDIAKRMLSELSKKKADELTSSQFAEVTGPQKKKKNKANESMKRKNRRKKMAKMKGDGNV
ncbi:hypothetical protein KGF57_004782 [Candida theae]|uniref:Uncharacterized protein n=1 Tax=Candida theae TaxID=1198502 RepID=A0AAD5BAZ3_9ASCO|nr:uncharacterized protein KGF57_004782 [Candida theae]KAI5949184.1 hypothetical protein KGF57_004782 [Candida theae]